MKAYQQYKDEPRTIRRAPFLETYLREKTIFILEDELIVGNVNNRIRGQTISGASGRYFAFPLNQTHYDLKNYNEVRNKGISSQGIVSPEERKELKEVILPYFVLAKDVSFTCHLPVFSA